MCMTCDGRKYIDGSGGPAVYCIGHSNEEVNDAIKRQLDLIAHGYRYNFSSDALEELTEIVRERCGGTLNHMVYVTGGSEAVESCLKLALQYQTAIGQMSRRRFIARERSLAWQHARRACPSPASWSGSAPSRARCSMSRACLRPMPIAPSPVRRRIRGRSLRQGTRRRNPAHGA